MEANVEKRLKLVLEALEDARGFGSFRERRTFNFLHLFSGKEDVLGNAIRDECKKANLKVKIHSVDRERVQGADMLSDEPYGQILKDAQEDFFDGGHSGYPCGSFSRARYNEKGEGPPPVRSLQHVYGLPSNNSHRQAEADAGTVMCVRSINIVSEILQSQRRRGVPEAGTVENPQGSETGFEGPSWALPEMIRFTEVFALMEANFNTCAYQRDSRRKWFKPGRFTGRLNQLESMSRPCTCTSSFRHEALVGKKLTSEAAQFPLELCRSYAALVVKAWKDTLSLEWWRHQAKQKGAELSSLQEGWAKNKLKKSIPEPAKDDDMRDWEPEGIFSRKRAWEAGDLWKDSGPGSVRDSKKVKREQENAQFLGGNEKPARGSQENDGPPRCGQGHQESLEWLCEGLSQGTQHSKSLRY